jgi:hypothetical protein
MALLVGTVPLAGCAHRAHYDAVCTDAHTHLRVPDSLCKGSASVPNSPPAVPHYWVYYYRGGETAPAIGAFVGGGSSQPPADGQLNPGKVPANGAAVDSGEGNGSTGGDGGDEGGSTDGGSGEGGGGGGGE